MHKVGFEPTIPVFERANTFHALDCATTVIGSNYTTCQKTACFMNWQDYNGSYKSHPVTQFLAG
jgi:hypothetical protein